MTDVGGYVSLWLRGLLSLEREKFSKTYNIGKVSKQKGKSIVRTLGSFICKKSGNERIFKNYLVLIRPEI